MKTEKSKFSSTWRIMADIFRIPIWNLGSKLKNNNCRMSLKERR